MPVVERCFKRWPTLLQKGSVARQEFAGNHSPIPGRKQITAPLVCEWVLLDPVIIRLEPGKDFAGLNALSRC